MAANRTIRLVSTAKAPAVERASAEIASHGAQPVAAPSPRIDIRSRCSAGKQLTLTVVPSGVPSRASKDFICFLRRIDGKALPNWLVPISNAIFTGICPDDVDSLDLKARLQFAAQDHCLVQEFRVDTRTGAITWLTADATPGPPLFRDQITKFSEFGDDSADGLSELLFEDEPRN